MIKIIYYKA